MRNEIIIGKGTISINGEEVGTTKNIKIKKTLNTYKTEIAINGESILKLDIKAKNSKEAKKIATDIIQNNLIKS